MTWQYSRNLTLVLNPGPPRQHLHLILLQQHGTDTPRRSNFSLNTTDAAAIYHNWDFGDGTTKLHADNIETHQYTDPGQYKVTLTVTLTNLSTNETVNESYSDNLTVQ